MAPIYPVHSHYTETGTVYDNAGTPIQVNKAGGTKECVGKSRQKLVEVDHYFRPRLLNPLINIAHTAKIFRNTQ